MCTRYCTWQALNDARRDPEVVRREHVRAMVHLEFMCELYREQADAGRYFLHEHPATATSWTEECVEKVLEVDGVETDVGDRCRYDQCAEDGTPVKKPTKWMSNSPEVLKTLNRRCLGRGGTCSRRAGGVHTAVEGSVTRGTAIYPFALCKAILQGFRNQLVADGRLVLGVVGVQRPEETLEDRELERMCTRALGIVIELNEVRGGEESKDAITGQRLRADLVRAARREELEYFAMKRVWAKVPRREAMAKQGKPPISVKWIDVNKGDDEGPNYRSRLVAREIRRAWEASVFAPTPPLEALRSVISLAATDLVGHARHVRDPNSEKRTQISVIDIKRACFNARIDDEQPTYVELPAEDPDKTRGMCARLLVHMYGTRRAGDGWHSEYSDHLVEQMGFTKGGASSCVFRHVE